MSTLHPSIDDPEKHFLGNLLSDEDSFTNRDCSTREHGSGISRAAVIVGACPVGPPPNQRFWPEPPPPYSPPAALNDWMASETPLFNARMMGTMKHPSEWNDMIQQHHTNTLRLEAARPAAKQDRLGGSSASSRSNLMQAPRHTHSSAHVHSSLPTSPVETASQPKLPFSYRDVANRGVRTESLSCLLSGKVSGNPASIRRSDHHSSSDGGDFAFHSTPQPEENRGGAVGADHRNGTRVGGGSAKSEFQKITRKKNVKGPTCTKEKKNKGVAGVNCASSNRAQQQQQPQGNNTVNGNQQSVQTGGGGAAPALAYSVNGAVENALDAHSRFEVLQKLGTAAKEIEAEETARKGSSSAVGSNRLEKKWSGLASSYNNNYNNNTSSQSAASNRKAANGATRKESGASGRGRSARKGEKHQMVVLAREEALERLLSVAGEDAYTVLGVRADALDEEIRRFYKKQAVFVHPDKNNAEGAAEAFQVLSKAFEAVGTTEARRMYDEQRFLQSPVHQELAELYEKLRAKVEEARNCMNCDCGQRHARITSPLPMHSARYCRRCDTRHPAKNSEIWAESKLFGFIWVYYTCVSGVVYDITPWATCKANELKHMRADSHAVTYRMHTTLDGGGAGGGVKSDSGMNGEKRRDSDKVGAGAGLDGVLPEEYSQFIQQFNHQFQQGSSQSHASLRPMDRDDDRPRKAKRAAFKRK